MSRYCYAPEGIVLEGPRSLPVPWTDPLTGRPHSNLPSLSSAEQLALGWYPYVENDPGSPGPYHNRVLSDFTVHATNVSRDVTYQQWPIEQVRSLKNIELEGQLTQYQANEVAANPKINDYVNNELKWYADEQVRLAQLSDWNAVAAFDTTKPVVLTLPNSFVGESNVRQGIALTAQNNAAVDSGLSPIWDQPTINSFVAANQTAADDSSNSTVPTKPTYQIRQGIANVSEAFNRIINWRFDVEGETDPNLDRSMAMRMSNRQDSRPIYVFIFTDAGATFLGWKLFEDLGNGSWGWHLDKNAGDGAYMWRTDEDIAYILSYSQNHMVESEYFTDLIQFPAGVESQNLLVAWDPV